MGSTQNEQTARSRDAAAALRADAETIMRSAIRAVLPDEAVRRALRGFRPGRGRTLLVAVGKAAWQMAAAALELLGAVDDGVVITKYGHVRRPLPGLRCLEAGHPVPDENGFAATEEALALVRGLGSEDTVLFLLSGGGSALFEKPLIPAAELQDVTAQLLASGADIVEINCIRKRLSAVKGGRFALACARACTASYSATCSATRSTASPAARPSPTQAAAPRRSPWRRSTSFACRRRRASCWLRRRPKNSAAWKRGFAAR